MDSTERGNSCMNSLLKELQANDLAKGKKSMGYFNPNTATICYPTGFPTLDYRLGYKVNSFDDKGNPYTYNNLGLTAGTYTLLIGKSSTGKTAAAVKIAGNIIRPFENGMVLHFDNERAMNYTRIQALTGFKREDILNRWILRQEKLTLDDMKASLYELYKEKSEHKDQYLYNTGKRDEFGKEIILPVPTYVIIDSVANISSGIEDLSIDKIEEVGSQTDRLRLTGSVGRFFNEILNFLKEVNINLICINHIKVNPQLGIIKSPSEMLYLSNNESISGGRTHINLAHVFIKFTNVSSEKYDSSEEGFDGFKTRLTLIKSRTNSDGKNIELIYDKITGHNMVRSTVDFAKEQGLISGNKNGYYFITDPDKNKFTLANMPQDFKDNPKLYKIMADAVNPILEKDLAYVSDESAEIAQEELDYYNL